MKEGGYNFSKVGAIKSFVSWAVVQHSNNQLIVYRNVFTVFQMAILKYQINIVTNCHGLFLTKRWSCRSKVMTGNLSSLKTNVYSLLALSQELIISNARWCSSVIQKSQRAYRGTKCQEAVKWSLISSLFGSNSHCEGKTGSNLTETWHADAKTPRWPMSNHRTLQQTINLCVGGSQESNHEAKGRG